VAQDGIMNLMAELHPLRIVLQPIAKLPDDPALAAAYNLSVRLVASYIGWHHLSCGREQDALSSGRRHLVAEDDRHLVAPSFARPVEVVEAAGGKLRVGHDDADAVQSNKPRRQPANLDHAAYRAGLHLEPIVNLVRPLQIERYASEEARQHVTQGEAQHGNRHAGGRQNAGKRHTEHAADHEEGCCHPDQCGDKVGEEARRSAGDPRPKKDVESADGQVSGGEPASDDKTGVDNWHWLQAEHLVDRGLQCEEETASAKYQRQHHDCPKELMYRQPWLCHRGCLPNVLSPTSDPLERWWPLVGDRYH
jgi:hypothetical protein